jgi:GGDEF domain-containing protein
MVANPMAGAMNDDPRRLRGLLERACALAREHAVPSVMLGLSARQGDRSFPEFVDFLQSALRVEDAIFRMTRERAVVHLADLDPDRAREVFDRLVSDFSDEFPSMNAPEFDARFYEVKPGASDIRLKDVLTEIFAPHTVH